MGGNDSALTLVERDVPIRFIENGTTDAIREYQVIVALLITLTFPARAWLMTARLDD